MGSNEVDSMFIPRFLVLPLAFALSAASLVAESKPEGDTQSSVAHPNAQQQFVFGPLQDFRSHDANPPGSPQNPILLDKSKVTCYSIRSYRVTRDDPKLDSTRPSGYSTCQPSDRFQVKDAQESPQILYR
jgi:hypothetical protein